MEDLRDLKEAEVNLRKKIRKVYIYNNPKASPEKIDGAVFRCVYEHKLKKTLNN